MKLYFDDEAFDGQLQRSVGKSDSGMANVGECLAIGDQITQQDRDSWYQAWSDFAGSLVARGDKARAAGNSVSARNAYLRAAEYFRQAFFFHREDLDAIKLREAYAASVAAFQSALELLDHPGRALTGALSGYLFTPASAGPHPTVLHIGGYDGTAEELYASVASALDRGYAFAASHGHALVVKPRSLARARCCTTTSPVRNSSAYSLRPKAPKDTAKVWRRLSSGTPPTTGLAVSPEPGGLTCASPSCSVRGAIWSPLACRFSWSFDAHGFSTPKGHYADRPSGRRRPSSSGRPRFDDVGLGGGDHRNRPRRGCLPGLPASRMAATRWPATAAKSSWLIPRPAWAWSSGRPS